MAWRPSDLLTKPSVVKRAALKGANSVGTESAELSLFRAGRPLHDVIGSGDQELSGQPWNNWEIVAELLSTIPFLGVRHGPVALAHCSSVRCVLHPLSAARTVLLLAAARSTEERALLLRALQLVSFKPSELILEQGELSRDGVYSRRRDCHSAAPPSPFSRCFNMGVDGTSAE